MQSPSLTYTPCPECMMDTLSRVRYLSTLDLTNGYEQISLEDKAQKKCAFITDMGLYEYKVLPFVPTNARVTFQRLINYALAGLNGFASVYIDGDDDEEVYIIQKTLFFLPPRWKREERGNLSLSSSCSE